MVSASLAALDAPSLLGREAELTQIQALLDESRLVTVTGVGGIGKTRLAARIARARLATDLDEVTWFVDLSAISDLDQAIEAIAHTFGLGSDAVIAEALAGHGPALLVLDDLERLVPAIAVVIDRWLDAAPSLRVLATSRARLHLAREVLVEVAPLDAAVELFVARARGHLPDFTPSEVERATIAAIVAKLDGIPLAIELAAARVRVLPVAELLQRIDGLELLSARSPGRAPRQATMRAALDASFDLLTEEERGWFVAAGAFRGSFDLDAFAAVSLAHNAVDAVEALVDRSLVRALPGPRARYALYGPVRAYAYEKLDDAILRRHAQHLSSRAPAEEDRADLEAALLFTSEHPSLDALGLLLAVSLDAVKRGDGLRGRALEALDKILGRAPLSKDPSVARARLARSLARTHAGRLDDAESDAKAALAIVDDDPALEALACSRLGQARFRAGDPASQVELARRARTRYLAAGDQAGALDAAQEEAVALLYLGRSEEARALLGDVLQRSLARDDARAEIFAETALGFDALERGDLEASREHYLRCLERARAASATRSAMIATGYLGLLHFAHGRLDDAIGYLGPAIDEARAQGDPIVEALFLAVEGAARAQLGDFDAAARSMAKATSKLEGRDDNLTVARLLEGHLDLSKARAAARTGDLATWSRLRAAARARLDAPRRVLPSGGNLLDRSALARIGDRLLEAALIESDEPRSPSRASDAPRALEVAADGSWFARADTRVDLSRRAPLRRVFSALIDHHAHARGVPLSFEELVSRGWPDERIQKSAARNRLHVALVTLRALGLRSVIERRPEGYLLDPRIELHAVDM